MNTTKASQAMIISERILKWMGALLVATVWISAVVFGLYILTFYALALFNGNLVQWNDVLPELYDPNNQSATIGIGIHFMAGGVILMLGCIQLMSRIRQRYLNFHRWVGRVYVVASILAALGGLAFIFLQGTIGGWVMDIGFGLYGVLMFAAAIETIRHARAKRLEKHRAWALRLFALAIGSWLYRMDYGFWITFTDGLGHTDDFHGAFDRVMAFFFYIPNLIVAEIFIGRVKLLNTPVMKIVAAFFLLLAAGFLMLGSYYFIERLWGPAIMNAFGG